jgi:hypothetical protein
VTQLATILLDSGRTVYLRGLYVQSTYGGFLEGYPNAKANARIVRSQRDNHNRISSAPLHVIEPALVPKPGHLGPGAELPAVVCRGLFVSVPLPGSASDGSHLEVVWFQDHVLVPVAEFSAPPIRALPWNDLAADYDLLARPSCRVATVFTTRSARVGAFFASSIQRTHSLRWV